MVLLADIQASNTSIASALPAGLVAVFVGATNGIGETTLKQFAKYALKPRVYFIGRSQEAGERIERECKTVNPDGQFVFIKSDVSLLRNVDEVCRGIKDKESVVNLLLLCQGSADFFADTSEGLKVATALSYYSRARFIVDLLPLLQRASALRRVVSVFAGGKEGPVAKDDFPGTGVSILAARGHLASVVTLSLEALARKAPNVSFLHEFPGPVQTGFARDGKGVIMFILKVVFAIIGPFISVPIVESGERHLFIATSARYPARGSDGDTSAAAVPLENGVAVARGIDGQIGSGVYSVGWDAESAGSDVETLLAGYKTEGLVGRLWDHTEEEFKRITGSDAA